MPHIGSATIETRNEMGFRALDNLDAVFAGVNRATALPKLPDRHLLPQKGSSYRHICSESPGFFTISMGFPGMILASSPFNNGGKGRNGHERFSRRPSETGNIH